MTWIHNALAGLGFFLISLFGGAQTPVITTQTTPPAQQTATTSHTALITANSAKAGANSTSTGNDYSVQGQTVYWNFNDSPLTGADAATFHEVDKSADWFLSDTGPDFAVDKSHVYEDDKAILGFDPSTFKILSGYITDANTVYCTQTPTSAAAVDPQGFISVLPQANESSFKVLITQPRGNDDEFEPAYATDGTRVYSACSILPSADPATFKTINYPNGTATDFARDASHVYGDVNYNNSLISNVDAATFALVPETTQVWSGYVKDKNGIYNTYVTKTGTGSTETLAPVVGADLATFEGVDPATTTCDPDWELGTAGPAPVGCYDAKDANHKYLDGQIVQ